MMYCVKCGIEAVSGQCPVCDKNAGGETLVMVSPKGSVKMNKSWYLCALNGQVQGKTYEIPSGRRIHLGRGSSNEIDLHEVDVSHRHAVLSVSTEGLWLEDLGSRNGTFVNGMRLREPVLLNENDLIQIAHLQFRVSSEPSVTARPLHGAVGAGAVISPHELACQSTVGQGKRLYNGQWKVFYGWLVFTLIAFASCFAPALLDTEMMENGFALITLALLLTIVGIVCTGFYLHRALTLDKIFSGENLLVHWQYTPQEWQKFTEDDYRMSRFEKVPLFIITLILSLVIGGALVVVDPEGGIWVFGFLMLVMFFIGVLVLLLPMLRHARRGRTGGWVYIGVNGLCINDEFHNWNLLGGRLDAVKVFDSFMEFEYSYLTRTGREECHVRVLIPNGEEAVAHRLAAYFNCRAC